MASGGLPRFRLSGGPNTPLRGAGLGGAAASASSAAPGSSPFNRRGPNQGMARGSMASGGGGGMGQPSHEEKEADDAALSAAASSLTSWKGGALQASAASLGHSASATPVNRRSNSSVLGPLQSAQGTGFEISNEIDSLRLELNELRLSNDALQGTNRELHEALAQVTERSKMLSGEHARFLDEFRDKSQRSKQKLINDRQSLKLNLSNTNTRLEDLEKLNNNIEGEKMKVVRKLEDLTAEHDQLSVKYATIQQEKQIWMQKEEEYLEIQQIQTRNLEELNATVLQIQEEREGWHARAEDIQAELNQVRQQNSLLESTVREHETSITHANSNLLTAQEEIMNLTQTLATHLEQIANISKQNKELHQTLVNFTRTNDKEFVSEMLPNITGATGGSSNDRSLHSHHVLHHTVTVALAADQQQDRSDAHVHNMNPSFNGPIPHRVHSAAFLQSNPAGSPHPSASPGYNFLHTTSGLSTLHLPANYITSKLSSYILWILEHKQILENMQARKEKLRKELEEQIVVANLEAQVVDHAHSGGGAGGIGLSPGSPRPRSASPLGRSPSPTRSSLGPLPLPSSALPPPTLLLPSLLQHTLHDLHELTHLTQHDSLQFANFETERNHILRLCSDHGAGAYNTKRAKTAWNIWVAALNQRVYRRQTLHRILQQNYLRQLARAFARFHNQVLVRFGLSKIQEKSNEMKSKIVRALLQKSEMVGEYACQIAFIQWRTHARRRKQLRQRLVQIVVAASDTKVVKLWTRWKSNVLKLRHTAAVAEGAAAQESFAANARAEQLDKMRKMLTRQMMLNGSTLQRTCFVSWRAWSSARRIRKRQALKRIIYICCGQGMLIKAWTSWKQFKKSHEIATVSSDLASTKETLLNRFIRQRKNFLVGYGQLRDRLKNFKVYHWWRLAYIDTQWMHREDQWRRALVGQKQIQLRTLVRMHRAANYLPIFKAWKKLAKDSKRGKIKSSHKIFQRLITIQLHHAFNRWVRYLEERRVDELKGKLTTSTTSLQEHKQKFIASLVSKWRRHHLSNAFTNLYDQVQSKKARKREILDRTCRRLEHSHVWSAFRLWQSYCEKSAVAALKGKIREQKGKFSSVLVQRWRMGCMVPAFATWRERVAQRKEHRREVLDRTFKKLMNSSLWRAMRLWRRFTEQSSIGALRVQLAGQVAASKQARIVDLVKRWRMSSLVPAWNQWQNFISLRKRKKKDLLDRCCKRLQHSALWKSFRTWALFSEKAAIAQMRGHMEVVANHAADQRLRMVEHILAKWKTKREKERFIAWRTYTKESRTHKKSILDRTLKHLSSGYLGQGWRMWKRYVDMSRMHDMKNLLNENKAKTAAQAIKKWRHRILTTPFLNWKHHAKKSKAHKREVIERMVKRLVNSRLYKSFRIWTEFLEQTKVAYMKHKFLDQKAELNEQLVEQKQKRIQALIQRWRGASLSTRFQQWRIYARTNRAKKKVRIDQIFKRLVAGTVYKAWRTWLEFVELHRAHQQLVSTETAMAEMKRQNTIDAQNVRQKHILTKTLDRMCNLLLFSGWREWIEFTQASRANDITKQKNKLEAQALLMQKQQSDMMKAHQAQLLERKQILVDKTLRRIAYANLYQALRIWKKEAEDRTVFAMQSSMKQKENELKLRLITDKIRQHRRNALLPLMNRWSKYAKARRARKRELMGKMVKRMMNMQVWSALRFWRDHVHNAAIESMRTELSTKLAHQKKARMEHLIRTWRHRSLQPSFVGWRQYTHASHKRKRLMTKIFARIAHIQLFNAFREWKNWRAKQIDAENKAARQHVILDRTFKRMCHSMQFRAFNTWMLYADLHKQHQINSSLQLLRSNAVQAKFASLTRTQSKTVFQSWHRFVVSTRKERGMKKEMSHFHKCDVLDRTLRRLIHTSLWKSFAHWRTYILRARLIVNDKLGEYSATILTLRQQSEMDSLKLHEYLTENQKLKSNILSIKHKQHTMAVLSEKQKENRAILFSYNTILSNTFRAFYQRIHFLKRRKLTLHKSCQHVKENVMLRGINQWKKQIMLHRSHMMALALETAKKQLDQCLGKVWSLESQLAHRTAESASVAAESQALLLNAQAQEVNHALEKQMPSDREIALATEVDTLAAKLELLLKEVKERGNHIQFLSAENQRLSAIFKATPTPGFPSAGNTINASSASALPNQTLNLSSSSGASFARSRGIGGASSTQLPLSSSSAAAGLNSSSLRFGASSSMIQPTSSPSPSGGTFFPQS